MKILIDKQAVLQALEALQSGVDHRKRFEVCTVLRTALDAAEGVKPYLYAYTVNGLHECYYHKEPPNDAYDEGTLKPLYLHPAPAINQEPVSIIEQLWAIIDDIDTYGDMAKSDDKLFRSLVERRQKDRWKTGITTDGYSLTIPTHPAPAVPEDK